MDCETSVKEEEKDEDETEDSAGKTTVILLKQLCLRTKDEIGNEEDEKFYAGAQCSCFPRMAWSLLAWDGTLEGISLISTLYHDINKAKEHEEANGGDGADTSMKKEKKVEIVKMHPYPRGFGSMCGNNFAIWNHEIFFMGGTPIHNLKSVSSRLLSFHTMTEEEHPWNTKYKRMKRPRSCHVVAAIRGLIYVFGDSVVDPAAEAERERFPHETERERLRHETERKRLPPTSWAECYCIKDNIWHSLPPPSPLLYKLYQPSASAVYRKCQPFVYTTNSGDKQEVVKDHDLILLLHDEPGSPISIFNCTTKEWLPDMYPPNPANPNRFPYCPRHQIYQDRFAVLGGVIIWHDCGDFHGYDIVNQQFLEFPFSRRFRTYAPVYLVRRGDDKLLILCQSPMDTSAIDCRMFQVKQDHASFHLHYVGYRNIGTNDQFGLQDAQRLCEM